MSYFTHLECGSGCGAGPFDPRERHFLCPSCGLPLMRRVPVTGLRHAMTEANFGAGCVAMLWGFISPGLYRREKRYAIPFVLSSTLLFCGGVYFCYAMVLEPAYEFAARFHMTGEPAVQLRLDPLPEAADFVR